MHAGSQTLVLASSIQISWAFNCLLQPLPALLPSSLSTVSFAINGFAGGLPVLVLSPARQLQVGLYLFRHCLDSSSKIFDALILGPRTSVKSRRVIGSAAEMALFSLGSAALVGLAKGSDEAMARLGGMGRIVAWVVDDE